MGEFIPFVVLAIFLLIGGFMKRKIAALRTKTYRPHPAQTVSPSPAPAAPRREPAPVKTEDNFRESSFDSETDFESGSIGVSPDPDVTYEEGIDPCHDGMDHAAPESLQEETGMSRETANELVRGFVMSEVFSRRKRR